MSNSFNPGSLDTPKRLADQISGIRKISGLMENSDLMRTISRASTLSDTFSRAYCEPLLNLQHQLGSISKPPVGLVECLAQMESYNKRFLIPKQTQFDELSKAMPALPSVKMLGLESRLAELQAVLSHVKVPWLNMANGLASITAMYELHVMAAGILEHPPFSKALTAVLRNDLGDWRGITALPDSLFTNPMARFDFYRDLGFKDALTDFPQSSFQEILDSTRLRPPILLEPVDTYGHGLDLEADEETTDEVPPPNLEAYTLLYRLESQLRRFIDEQMTAQFGPSWVKQQTPGGMYTDWRRKRREANDAGQSSQPLIAYADFTDYSRIICRKDNWNHVFKPFFNRKSDIEESLIRLRPARICTMHVRIIMPDDHLMIRAEAIRILRAIGVLE